VKQGRGAGSPAAALAGRPGHGGDREEGEKGEGPRRIDPPPHPERGWGVAAWPWWCAAAGGDGRGGGTAG